MTVRSGPDRFASAQAVADAVLYEGYVLYPYRASSRKNQIRWQFGVLTPRSFAEADGSERWSMRTECLVAPAAAGVGAGTVTVRLRFLQLQNRQVEEAVGEWSESEFIPAATLEVDGTVYVSWDEVVDREVDLDPIPVELLVSGPVERKFRFDGAGEVEELRGPDAALAGRLVRHRDPVDGLIRVEAVSLGGPLDLTKIVVRAENTTAWSAVEEPVASRSVARSSRDGAMTRSLISVHTMLAVDGGRFVSLFDPPDDAVDAVALCSSDGTFPVLIGGDDVVLSSPIILYDHPEVAAESPGDLYDSTEIDEILALRVMTLTEAEKMEARGTDPRAAAVIDRCDNMPPEMWERLHGAVRSIGPSDPDEWSSGTPWDGEVDWPTYGSEVSDVAADSDPPPWWDPGVDGSVDPETDSVWIGGVEIGRGASVRLMPTRRSDAQDLFLKGMTAKVAAVFRDVDGNDHVAVTVDDDPASAELVWQGRYLYFHPDEIEPLAGEPLSSERVEP